MNIGPIKERDEPHSTYHFRMMLFCASCMAFFGFLLGLMLIIRPEVNNSAFPLVIMMLWFGIPMAIAASVLTFIAYTIGALISLGFERYAKTKPIIQANPTKAVPPTQTSRNTGLDFEKFRQEAMQLTDVEDRDKALTALKEAEESEKRSALIEAKMEAHRELLEANYKTNSSMSWNRFWYGKTDPSFSQKVMIFGLMTLLAFSIYGIWADFVPSVAWVAWGLRLSIVFAVFSSISLYWGYYTGRLEMERGISPSKKVFVLLFIPLFLFGFGWLALVHGLPDLATDAIGSPFSITTVLHKDHGYSRRSCHYRLKGEALERAFPNHLCVSSVAYNSLSEDAPVKLEGKLTFLGFHIQNVYIDSASSTLHSGDEQGH